MLEIKHIASLTGHQNPIYALENSQKKGILFSAGNDKGIVEWNLKGENPGFIKVMFPVSSSVYAMHCPEGFPLLFAAERSGRVNVFNFVEQKVTHLLSHHKAPVFSIKSVLSKKELILSSEDGSVSVWSMDTFEMLYSFPVAHDTVRVISISPDESIAAFGCKDNQIRIYNLIDYSLLHVLNSHTLPVTSLEFSPDGKRLFSGSRDAQIKVWDTNQFIETSNIAAHLFSIYAIAHHPTADYFASASRDKTIKIWGSTDLELKKTISLEKGFPSHRLSINSMIWSNWEPNMLITAGDDKEIKLWDFNF